MEEYKKAHQLYEQARAEWERCDALVTAHCLRCSWHLEAILAEDKDEVVRAAELLSARQALAELQAARESERQSDIRMRQAMFAWMDVRDSYARGPV